MNRQVGAVSWQTGGGGQSASGESKKIPFLNMSEYDTSYKMRVVSDQPMMYHCHWVTDSSGRKVKVNCTLNSDCPVVDEKTKARCAGKLAQSRYYVKVIDRSDNQVKVLDIGPQIYNAIAEYAADDDWGHPSGYDISVKKGKKGDNPLYVVKPSPKDIGPLSDDEKQLVADSEDSSHENHIDLEARVQPLPAETITKIMTGESEQSDTKARAGRTASANTTSSASENKADLTEGVDEDDLIDWGDDD